MPSAYPTSRLKQDMAATVHDTFAERTDRGEIDDAAVVIKWPDGREIVRCKAILSGAEVNDVGGYEGTQRPMSQMTADIDRTDAPDLDAIPLGAIVVCRDQAWRLAPTGHRFGLHTIRLVLEDPSPVPSDKQPGAD